MRSLKLLIFSASLVFVTTCAPKLIAQDARNNHGHDWVEQRLHTLSLPEKVGQMLQIRAYGDYNSFSDPEFQATIDQVNRYHVGSLLLGARMGGSNLIKKSPAEVAAILNEFQRNSKIPLLVAADVERGLASRVGDSAEFPFPMAFGAADDPSAVEHFGEIVAKQSRAIGSWPTVM